jgi:hypothetical protein
VKKTQTKSTDVPQTEQRRFPVPGLELGESTSIPRDTSYDLVACPSRTRFIGYDEQTFKVVKKGNCP